MKKNQLILSILLVGIAFGTAWAIRGQFGHEPGAAFAGIIGVAALLLVARRADWYNKMLPIIAAGAIGWGTTGMISYGMVVGYCRALDLLNSTYGFLSLYVIGGLFGLIGGGLVGLSLNSTSANRVKWPSLVAEMAAGGLIGYYFLIVQAELLMTPPRSEAWAICLGAGAMMVWHMVRNGFSPALRVAFYAMLGAGFGFSFGNLLQTTGNVLQLHFNMWNVMEYNIGFWGGSGMAYGVFTSVWPTDIEVPRKYENNLSLMVILLVVPLLVWKDAFMVSDLVKSNFIQNDASKALFLTLLTFVILVAINLIVRYKLRGKTSMGQSELMMLFLLLFSAYIIWSYLVTGLFMGNFRSEQPLYVLNLIAFLLLLRKSKSPFQNNQAQNFYPKDRWALYFGLIIAIILLLPLISQLMHGGIPNANMRFPILT
ncbi:MAG: hypothetical protein M0R39_00540 [Prolixibacteraceae bacterium]|nr:hypothetical protein [Prolixibacteraceae bacterium]